MVKPKLRIMLLDDNLATMSDRLVDQYEELLYGPKQKHDGPVRLEVTMISKDDKEKFIAYLERLSGKLPLSLKSTVKKTASNKGKNPYKQIYLDLKKKNFIEEIVDYLEEVNFRWVTEQFIEELPTDKKPVELPVGYQWLVRMEKQAKDPANDRFDFKLMVGIKFLGGKSEKVYIFYNGQKKAFWKRPWQKSSNINMKKKKIALIFPSYMSIDERKKWRALRRKVELGKTLGPRDEQFYQRYLPEVQNLDPLKSK